MALEAIRYQDGRLEILDQLLLPQNTTYIDIKGTEEGWTAINRMQVRGAPAIAVVGALSLAVELHQKSFDDLTSLLDHVTGRLDYLVTARPTAVNMADTARKMANMTRMLAEDQSMSVRDAQSRLLAALERMLKDDVTTNKAMSDHGARHVLRHYDDKPVTMLTHCNTGSLATAGYGTALGVVRSLHSRGKLAHCYCTETRPYNQGSRLTAYELVHEQIPATLVCDSMAAMLMSTRGISAVVVGADRVVANGDTANKVGTYQLAILAKHHGVPFYVVAPSTSIDLTLQTGSQIQIEERPAREMTSVKGIEIAAPGIGVWNPAFDVTPADLITGGIVTEFGVIPPGVLEEKLSACLHDNSTTGNGLA